MSSLKLLHVADWLINLFVIAPVLVGFWCGIFELFDQYLNSDVTQKLRNATVTTAIGACFYLVYFLYPLINRFIANFHPAMKHILITITMLLGTIPHMAYWKGLWMFTYWFLEPENWKMNLAACIGCIGVKVLTGSTSGLIFPPFSCSVDTCEDVMKPKDFLGNEFPGIRAKSLILYSLGSAVSVFLFNSFTIFCWASAFCLVDKFGLNEDDTLYIMLGISTSVVVIMFLLEVPVAKVKRFMIPPRMPLIRRLYVSTVSNGKFSQIDVDLSDYVFALQNAEAEVVVKIDQNQHEVATCRKVSRFCWSPGRFANFLFDSVLNLIIFALEIFLLYSSTALYDRIFFKDRFYGAALSSAVGGLLLSLLQITSLFGGTCSSSDWLEVFDTSGDETEMEKEELHLYPNMYARYLKGYFTSTLIN